MEGQLAINSGLTCHFLQNMSVANKNYDCCFQFVLSIHPLISNILALRVPHEESRKALRMYGIRSCKFFYPLFNINSFKIIQEYMFIWQCLYTEPFLRYIKGRTLPSYCSHLHLSVFERVHVGPFLIFYVVFCVLCAVFCLFVIFC